MLYADFREEHETLAARENEFRGKHIVVVGKEIHEIENGEQGAQLLKRLRKEHPDKIPLITYVMTEEIYIL